MPTEHTHVSIPLHLHASPNDRRDRGKHFAMGDTSKADEITEMAFKETAQLPKSMST